MQNLAPDWFFVDIEGVLVQPSDLDWVQSMPGAEVYRDTQGRPAQLRLHRSHIGLFQGLSKKLEAQDKRAIERWEAAHLEYWGPILRPYQLEAVRFIRPRHTTILADDLGLGKTLTALVAADPPVLICCPLSVVDTWANELHDWMPKWRVHIVRRSKDWAEVTERGPTFWSRMDALVVPYSQHSRLPYLSVGGVVGPPFTVILDECHVLTNKRVQYGQSIRTIGTARMIGLSATPLRNGLESLWGLLDIVAQRSFGTRNQYLARYCGGIPHPFCQGAVQATEPTNQAELNTRLAEVIIKRSREEVRADLPEHHRERMPVEVEAGPIFEAMRAAKDGHDGAQALTIQGAVRMHLGKEKSSYLTWLMVEHEFLKQDRAVIWFWHKECLDIVAKWVKQLGWPHDVLRGGTASSKRAEILAEWGNTLFDPEPRLLLASISAAGVGLSLKNCKTAVFVEIDWSPVQTMQAEKRHHRFGNVYDSVRTIYLMATHKGKPIGTDHQIIEALDSKVEASTQAVGRDSQEEQMLFLKGRDIRYKEADQAEMERLVKYLSERGE